MVNPQVSEPRRGQALPGSSTGYRTPPVLFRRLYAPWQVSTWTWWDLSRSLVYLVTHLNVTQLFSKTKGTVFPVITIWPPAMRLSNAS